MNCEPSSLGERRLTAVSADLLATDPHERATLQPRPWTTRFSLQDALLWNAMLVRRGAAEGHGGSHP